jgi:hypothetical protein
MNTEEHSRRLFKNSEERSISLRGSKKVSGLIREAYQSKVDSWSMSYLKKLKNEEEKWLKKLQIEQQYTRQKMNEPFYKRSVKPIHRFSVGG